LLNNTIGSSNTAVGNTALLNNTTGLENTAVGRNALVNIITGSDNIAVGFNAGINITTGSNNIDIGNAGVAGDNGVIRIGTLGTHTTAFMAGIDPNITGSPAVVTIDTITGQLGIIPSALKFKENIQDINEESSPILDLRPVTFNYKTDPTHTKHFGLIAEEVNEILPILVIKNGASEILGVKYHELATLLLNELIKTNARLAVLEEQISY